MQPRTSLRALALACAFAPCTFAPRVRAQTAIDPKAAAQAFAEAKHFSDRDDGHLWGVPLYGPMLFIDPGTRAVVANQPDAQGRLHPEGAVFAGTLPPDVPVANTALDWSGTHWTTVMWPLPANPEPRDGLMMHELFHRIQPTLHLPFANALNPQLDALDGRYWLELEWRALAVALLTTGASQDQAFADAVAFRNQRQHEFPGSTETERALMLNEGLAEYTGLALAAPDLASARWRAARKLVAPDPDQSFVRGFAYTSGPAYGLLLDERLPRWRQQLTPTSDITQLLAAQVRLHPGPPATRALVYGGAGLKAVETVRAAHADAERARYRARLVDGTTLTLLAGDKFNFSFDPNNLLPFGDLGTLYPTFQATSDWGTLNVTDGVLRTREGLTLAAPARTGTAHLEGPGYTLDLAPGYHLVPAPGRPGSFAVAGP